MKTIKKACCFVPALMLQADAFAAQRQLPQDLSPWGMYLAADWVVKSVMIVLLLASLLTWAIWAAKKLQLRQAGREARQLLDTLLDAASLSDLPADGKQAAGFGETLVQATRREWQLSSSGHVTSDGIKERLQARLDRLLANAGSHISHGTGALATIGSVAPFVGLFGTVWGIMNAFVGIAHSQTTNLAVVAPGIAEALLATALGLVAAIPAVVIYNHFSRAINAYRSLLADVSCALLILVSRDLDRQKPPRSGQPNDGA